MPMEWTEHATKEDPSDPSPTGQSHPLEATGPLFSKLVRAWNNESIAADSIRSLQPLQIWGRTHYCRRQGRTLHPVLLLRQESKSLLMCIRKMADQKPL